MKKKFSIIIPAYNCESVVKGALESIENQSSRNFEVIVVDGGSNDSTLDVVRSVCWDFEIDVVSESDKGIYDAMNKGIRRSHGDWLYFMGADDRLYDSDTLKVVEEVLAQDARLRLVYGNVLRSLSGSLYDGYFSPLKLIIKPICHQAMFFKRELFSQFGYYNLRYRVKADHEFNLRLFRKLGTDEIAYTPSVIACFAESGISSNLFDDRFWGDTFDLLSGYAEQYGPKSVYRMLLESYHFQWYLRDGADSYASKLVFSIRLAFLARSHRPIRMVLGCGKRRLNRFLGSFLHSEFR